MHRRKTLIVLAASCLISLSLGNAAGAADWPQWQGPNRNNKSDESGLLKSWPEGGPPRLWMFENCGVGYGGPAIADGRLYILGAREDEELLICLDAESGVEQWAVAVGEVYENNWGDGPRSTPTIVDGRAFMIGAKGNITCVDVTTRAVVWQLSMVDDLGGKTPNWGYCESPLVVGDHVFCTPGGEQGAIASLSKETGEVEWRATALTDEAHYSSLVVQTLGDRAILVQLLVSQLVGVDIETGDLLWSEPWPGQTAVIPTPIVAGSQVFATTGYGVGCMMVDVADDLAVTKVYENKVMKSKHDGVVLLDGNVFGYSDGAGWVCQDFETGESVWRERESLSKGAIGYADGRFYCLSEDEGQVVLIGATTEGWEEHGRFTLEPQTEIRKDAGRIWTHPVVSNGRLYFRDQDLVYCYDVRDASRRAAAIDRK